MNGSRTWILTLGLAAGAALVGWCLMIGPRPDGQALPADGGHERAPAVGPLGAAVVDGAADPAANPAAGPNDLGAVSRAAEVGGAPRADEVARLGVRVIDNAAQRIVAGVEVALERLDGLDPVTARRSAFWADEGWVEVATKAADAEGWARFEVSLPGVYRARLPGRDEDQATAPRLPVYEVPADLEQDLYVFGRYEPVPVARVVTAAIVDAQGAGFDEAAMFRWFGEPSYWRRRGDSRSAGVIARPTVGDLAVAFDYEGNSFVLEFERTDWSGALELSSHGRVVATRACGPGEDTVTFVLDPAGPDPDEGRGILELHVRSGPGGPYVRRAMVSVTGRAARRRFDTGDPGGPARATRLLPGEYQVQVTDVDHGPRILSTEVRAGEVTRLEVPLRPAADAILLFELPAGFDATELGAIPWVTDSSGNPLPVDVRRIDPEGPGELAFEAFGLPPETCWVGFHRAVFRVGFSPGDNGVRRLRLPPFRWVRVRAPVPLEDGELRLGHGIMLTLEHEESGLVTEYARCDDIGDDDAWVDVRVWAPLGRWRIAVDGSVNRHAIRRSARVVVDDTAGPLEVVLQEVRGG